MFQQTAKKKGIDSQESIDKIWRNDNRFVSDQLPLAQLLAYWFPEPPLEPPTSPLCHPLLMEFNLFLPTRPPTSPLSTYGIQSPFLHPSYIPSPHTYGIQTPFSHPLTHFTTL